MSEALQPIDTIDPVPEAKPRRKRGNGRALASLADTKDIAPVPISEGDAFLMMIERAARDPSVDIDKMERLMTMSERKQTREAEAAYNAAMAACQAELIPVARNLRNKQTSSNYADLAAIGKEAMPVIHRCGFGVIFSEFQSAKADHLGIAVKVTHAAGYSERHEFNVPMSGAGLRGNANMTPTHAYASTTTYGRRYALCCLFNIATEDDDGNGGRQQPQPTERITEQQAKDLEALAKRANLDLQIIYEHFRVGTLTDLSPAQAKTAVSKINKKLELEDAA